jgi:hypothetical protein
MLIFVGFILVASIAVFTSFSHIRAILAIIFSLMLPLPLWAARFNGKRAVSLLSLIISCSFSFLSCNEFFYLCVCVCVRPHASFWVGQFCFFVVCYFEGFHIVYQINSIKWFHESLKCSSYYAIVF